MRTTIGVLLLVLSAIWFTQPAVLAPASLVAGVVGQAIPTPTHVVTSAPASSGVSVGITVSVRVVAPVEITATATTR